MQPYSLGSQEGCDKKRPWAIGSPKALEGRSFSGYAKGLTQVTGSSSGFVPESETAAVGFKNKLFNPAAQVFWAFSALLDELG